MGKVFDGSERRKQMKVVIEKAENGFVMEVDNYRHVYDGGYEYNVVKDGVKRIIAKDLLDVFKELNRAFP